MTSPTRRMARYRERYATDPEFREHELARGRVYSNANREKQNARKRRWRASNIDHARARDRRDSARRRQRPEVRADAIRRTAAWYAADPARRRTHILARHGLTVEDYETLLAAQGGVCAICARPERTTIKGRRIRLAVDHHHDTGRRRGLLCAPCNLAIGAFGEDVDRLAAAIAYLQAVS